MKKPPPTPPQKKKKTKQTKTNKQTNKIATLSEQFQNQISKS